MRAKKVKFINKISTKLMFFIVVLQIALGIGVIIIYRISADQRINQLYSQKLADKKESLKMTTELVRKTVINMYQQAKDPYYITKEYRKQLSTLVNSTISLLNEQYRQLKKQNKSEKEIKTALYNLINNVRYNQGAGYLWVTEMDHTMLLHPVYQELEGKNQVDLKDVNGKRFIKELINVVNTRGEGFVHYHWTKPGEKEAQLKLSYGKQFTPYKWVIATGVYVDDVEKDALEKIKDQVSSFYYAIGTEKNNYFWINDLNYTLLAHPFQKDLINTNVMDKTDLSGKALFRELVDIANREGEGFVDYYWPRPGKEEPQAKLSYGKIVPALNWVISTGVYLDDINNYVKVEKERINRQFFVFVILIVAGVLITIMITLFLIFYITRPLNRVSQVMDLLTRKDLNHRIELNRTDEFGKMADGINHFVNTLTGLISKISFATNNINTNATEISTAVAEQGIISTMQSSAVTEITATVEQLSASSRQIAEYSNTVLDIAEQGLDNAKKGMLSVENTVREMQNIVDDSQRKIDDIIELERKSHEISSVMEIINNIADQTKLIAFNAALEASSAGESGKRFGVVAVEIRRLADSVMESTGDIAGKINEIQDSINRLTMASEKSSVEMKKGIASSTQTVDILKKILEDAKTNTDAALQISMSTKQQETANEQVVLTLKEITRGAHENVEAIHRNGQVTKDLLELAQSLKQLVDEFKLPDSEEDQTIE